MKADLKFVIKSKAKTVLNFIFNPRLLFCVGVGWMITNGWAYVGIGIGTVFKINWLVAVSTGYLAFLWFPFTPEKIVTLLIAMWLLKVLFPNDTKTLAVVRDAYNRLKARTKKTVAKVKEKKEERRERQREEDDSGKDKGDGQCGNGRDQNDPGVDRINPGETDDGQNK